MESAIAAEAGGADRLELNAALELDGLTPSPGLFKQVRKACNLPIIVMIRPHGQGFVYSDYAFASMLDDIAFFKEAGADGFAFGFLTPSLEIDEHRTSIATEAAGNCEKVVHRAFDITPSADVALDTLIACGVDRILTSGQAINAPAGTVAIKKLIERAKGRIEILPGAGIKPANVAQLCKESGCNQIHGTFRAPAPGQQITSGLDSLKQMPPKGTDCTVVAEIRKLVDS